MNKDNTQTETAQEILDGFKMKFMIAITVIFFWINGCGFYLAFFEIFSLKWRILYSF
jgi:hypothetical protein